MIENKNFEQMIKHYECLNCHASYQSKDGLERIRKECCNKPDLVLMKTEIDTKLYEEAEAKFQDSNLDELISQELQKKHIGDKEQIRTLFHIELTSYEPNPEDRMSAKVSGDTSSGKTNAVNTTLEHIPEETYEKLTSATKSVIEDDLDKRINLIVLTEVNLQRENGANSDIVETLKALAEGGLRAKKKDVRTNYKTTREEKTEQKSVIYTTTDEKSDLELGTREITITITPTTAQTKAVNENTLLSVANLEKVIQRRISESWLKVGLRKMIEQVGNYNILIPYATLLQQQLNGKPIIDSSNPRSKRDLKRLMSLVKTHARLHYKQRGKIDLENNEGIIISNPSDLISILKVAKSSLNQTYSGLDRRVSELYSNIVNEWIERSELQTKLNLSLNTLKKYLTELKNMGLIDINIGKNIDLMGLDSQKVFVKKCQNPVKPLLITCQINELETYLNNNYKEDIDALRATCEGEAVKNKVSNLTKEMDSSSIATNESDFDRVNLTPSFNPKEVQE